eukprot:803559_1
MDEDNDEIEWRSFVVVHKGDKHPFHIRDHHKAPEDPDALREIIPSISKYPNPAGSGHSTASNSRKNSDTSLSHVGWTAGWNSKRFPPPAFPDPLPDFSRYLFKCISHVSDDFQVFSAMGFIFSAYFADSRRRPAPTNHPNEKDALLSFPKVIHHRSLLPTSWKFSDDNISSPLFETCTELTEMAADVFGIADWQTENSVGILTFVFNPELVQLYVLGASRLVEQTNMDSPDDTEGRLIVHHPFDLHKLHNPVERSEQSISAQTMLWIDWGAELGTGECVEELYDVSLELRPENITFSSRLMASRNCIALPSKLRKILAHD